MSHRSSIVGAVTDPEYERPRQAAGFADSGLQTYQDYIARSPGDKTQEVANTFQAHSVNIEAMRPQAFSREDCPNAGRPGTLSTSWSPRHTIGINLAATAAGFY